MVLQNRVRCTKNSLHSNAARITLSAFGMQAIGGFACKRAAYLVSVWPVDVIFEIYRNRAIFRGDPMEVVYWVMAGGNE